MKSEILITSLDAVNRYIGTVFEEICLELGGRPMAHCIN